MDELHVVKIDIANVDNGVVVQPANIILTTNSLVIKYFGENPLVASLNEIEVLPLYSTLVRLYADDYQQGLIVEHQKKSYKLSCLPAWEWNQTIHEVRKGQYSFSETNPTIIGEISCIKDCSTSIVVDAKVARHIIQTDKENCAGEPYSAEELSLIPTLDYAFEEVFEFLNENILLESYNELKNSMKQESFTPAIQVTDAENNNVEVVVPNETPLEPITKKNVPEPIADDKERVTFRAGGREH
jgi:hypothetical protein